MKTDATLPPSRHEFHMAHCAIPAQHPAAQALLAAIDDAECGVEAGTISAEYAHEVLRWARRSGARMAEEIQSHQAAMQAQAELKRDVERIMVRWFLVPLLAMVLFSIGGAAAIFWFAR